MLPNGILAANERSERFEVLAQLLQWMQTVWPESGYALRASMLHLKSLGISNCWPSGCSRCKQLEMRPGDVLYMPKGVVHYAQTLNGTEAFHHARAEAADQSCLCE